MSAIKKNVLLHPYANVDINSWALRIRMIREALDLSRPKFAELIGVPATTLKNYELGYREVGWPFIRSMLDKETTRPLALALFVDLPALTVAPELNRLGEIMYTMPQITGTSQYSPTGIMRAFSHHIVNAMSGTELDTAYVARWVDCFGR